jgi:hypothetical protein
MFLCKMISFLSLALKGSDKGQGKTLATVVVKSMKENLSKICQVNLRAKTDKIEFACNSTSCCNL